MRNSIFLSAGLICLLLSPPALTAQEKGASVKEQASGEGKAGGKAGGNKPIVAAEAFLATLDDAQRARASVEYGSDLRVGWHFIPKESRKGLPLMDMNAEQQTAAKVLLRAAVSQLGYDKATTIMQLEGILLQLEGPKDPAVRNPEKYYFTLFGNAAKGQTWGLSVEGHHLSLNFSFQGNKIVDSTPQFMGSNPAKLNASFGEKFPQGFRALGKEEQLGFDLVTSLDEKQLATAMLGEVPEEIQAAGEAQPTTQAASGIAASELNSEQQATLKELIEVYSAKMKPGVSKQRWTLIEQGGFDNVKFAWAGAMKLGIGHYYRIQGDSFVIEFINVQADAEGNPANHVHCIWRDLQGDFNLPIK
ncbi:MAG: DUF3500 domain-containing protein [Aureliella sp.]